MRHIIFTSNSRRKKNKDDGSNVPYLETRKRAGEDNKDEQMPVSVDNHADILSFESELTRKLKASYRSRPEICPEYFYSIFMRAYLK